MNAYIPADYNQKSSNQGINRENTGWVVGNAPITAKASKFEYYGFPYKYEIIFTDNDSAYTGVLNRTSGVVNLNGHGGDFLFNRTFRFYVINKLSVDSSGQYEKCELVVEDLNANGQYDMLEDRILVGHAGIRKLGNRKLISWSGTVFGFDFLKATHASELPKPDDVYRIDFMRPFSESDSITFTVNGPVEVVEQNLNSTMEKIRVVPNPYIMTNSMEPAVANKFLNQRRRLMFTHIPANCEIRIFTSSGVFVDRIDVDGEPGNGMVHWDLLSKEDLEIAAGMYVYHIRSKATGKVKVGKFAVIK